MILLWGLAQDPSTRAVWNWLSRWNAKCFFLNHAGIYRTEVAMTAGPRLSFEVACGDESCRLEELSAAYLRPYNYREYPPSEFHSLPPSNPVMVHHLISAWAEYTPALVIGRPSAEAAHRSGLYQAAEIRAGGFPTPETLVTNDPAAVRDFRARHGGLICEPGPRRFEQRIAGQPVRIHVVAEECFSEIALPEEIGRKAVAVAKRLGLPFCGLDLLRTPDGQWYCLDADPNPAFTSFEDAGLVAQALARMLMEAPEPKRTSGEKTARPPLNGAGPMGRNYAVLREENC